MWLWVVCVFVCLSAMRGHSVDGQVQDETDLIQDPGHYLNSFLIKVDRREVAEGVARDHGFTLKEQLPQLDFYMLEHPEVSGRSKRSADDIISKLQGDPRVTFAEQQITLKRVKRSHQILHDKQLEFPIPQIKDRSLFYRVPEMIDRRGDIQAMNDENFDDMWYIHNTEQTGGKRDIDLNVEPAWEMGYTGKGVVVTILDDGIDHGHPDLKRNYEPKASADLNDELDVNNDPLPDKSNRANSHGTRCAGEIAGEANNGVCGVGVAYDCRIGGVRILDGKVTDALEAKALLFNNQLIDVYSASWGPQDNGRTMEGMKQATSEALREGVKRGRGGKGSIYVWATGNGGGNGDHCGADGYVSSPESISVQSMTDKGDLPFFGERCCSTMVAVPTGGEATKLEEIKAKYKIKVVTTDLDGGCVENFEGTSSAAPLASGCIALLLQANPELSWRDVQHILAHTARITIDDGMWTINGAGYHVNSKFGFGMMDCTRMIEAALDWKSVPEQHICEMEPKEVNSEIPSSGCHKLTFDFDGCKGKGQAITSLEHTQVHIKLETGRRGNTEIFLTSPAGTRSELLLRRPSDSTSEGIDFDFTTVHNWMENPEGQWTLEVCDNPGDSGTENRGTFQSFTMRAFGFESSLSSEEKQQAKKPSPKELESKMAEEYKRSRQVTLKRAQTAIQRNTEQGQVKIDKVNEKAKYVMTDLKNLFGTRSFEGLFSDKKLTPLGSEQSALKQVRTGYPPDEAQEQVREFSNVAAKDDVRGYPNQVDEVSLEEMETEVLEELTKLSDRELESVIQLYQQRKEEKEKRERQRYLVNRIRELLDNKK